MEKRDLASALREAGQVYEGAEPSREADRALRELLDQGSSPRSSVRWVVIGVALACVALAFVFIPRSRALGPFELERGSDDFRAELSADATLRVRSGKGTLVDSSMGESLEVVAPATVRKEAEGLRVIDGEVTFAVTKRAASAPPARIVVSHGAIEVLGTRFTVQQRADGGEVTLHEGSIRYTERDGRVRTLSGKGRLAWPLAPEPVAPAPEPAPPDPAPPDPAPPVPAPAVPAPAVAPSKPGTPFNADEFLARIDALRSRRDFEKAVVMLEAALRQPMPASTRERLSFELGSMLGHSIGDAARACKHWRMHVQRFAAGRYAGEVQEEQRRLKCGDAP